MARVILIAAPLAIGWLWMQIVHEFGHVLGAWSTGATVERVVLHPLMISRTDVAAAEYPLAVIWAGPIVGCVLPLLIWLLSRWLKWRSEFLFRFFAGFCLLANGAYLSAGSFDGIGDCGDLLRHGSPIWLLWLFGLVTIPPGLYLWHEQGRHFGLGPRGQPVDDQLAYWVAGFALLTVVVELAVYWIATGLGSG